MTGRQTTITHYRHGDTSACTARIRPPWLTADTRIVDCKSCERTHAYRNSACLPVETRADPADVPVITAWLEQLAS